MVQVAIDPSNWETKNIRSLQSEMTEAHKNGQYLFIWDKNGNVATFFKYQARLTDFARDVAFHREDKEKVLEQVRKDLV